MNALKKWLQIIDERLINPTKQPIDFINYLTNDLFNPHVNCGEIGKREKRINYNPKKKKECEREFCRFGPRCESPNKIRNMKVTPRGLNILTFDITIDDFSYTKYECKLDSWNVKSISLNAPKEIDVFQNKKFIGDISIPKFPPIFWKIPAKIYIKRKDNKPFVVASFHQKVEKSELLKHYKRIGKDVPAYTVH